MGKASADPTPSCRRGPFGGESRLPLREIVGAMTGEESTSVESSKVTQELMAVTAVVSLIEWGSGPKGKPTQTDRTRGAEPIAREGKRTTLCEE